VNILDLPLVGGHPALDLINSVERGTPVTGQEPHDYLIDPADLLSWARRVELVDLEAARDVESAWHRDPRAARAALAAVRDVRESLHTVLLAALGPGSPDDGSQRAALERLHRHWSGAIGRSTLVPLPSGSTAAALTVGEAPAMLIPDRAADAAVDLLRFADRVRFRRCPPDAGGCGWLFLDRSRNGSRKWCRMADCGTQVKSQRLTERRRADRA
jgi:predicted RNA-binding Zn ribbon-like protein